MAQFASFTPSQISMLKLARAHADKATRRAIKKDVFAAVKAQFGLPADMKLKVGMTSGHVKSKAGDPFPLAADGKWTGAPRSAPALKAVRVDVYALGAALLRDDLMVLCDLANDGALECVDVPDGSAPGSTTVVTDVDSGRASLDIVMTAQDFDNLNLDTADQDDDTADID